MLEMSELRIIVESLRSDDINERVAMLKALTEAPSGDPRLFQIIEALLDDHRACIIQLPILISEVCWLAAQALAAEMRAAGVFTSVRLAGVVCPVDLRQLNTRATQAYGPEALRMQILQRFERLQAAGKLPTFDLLLNSNQETSR